MQVEYQLDARGEKADVDKRTDVNGGRSVDRSSSLESCGSEPEPELPRNQRCQASAVRRIAVGRARLLRDSSL